MKKKKHWVIAGILCLAAAGGIIYGFSSNQIQNTTFWRSLHTRIIPSETLGESVYEVDADADSIYSLNYQSAVEDKITEALDEYTVASPLLLYNPFGTNTSSSLLVAYHGDEAYTLSYEIHVEDETIQNFSKTAVTVAIEEGYASQVIGFVYGEKNTLTLTYSDDKGKTIASHTYTIEMPQCATQNNTQLAIENGDSAHELSDGLFAVFGLDKSFNSNIYLYDNDGVLRGELPLKNYRSDRIEQVGDELLYSYSKNGFMTVNQLGKITNLYSIGSYKQHHEFRYDEEHNELVILVNEDNDMTIEDVMISLDLETNEVKELVDMKDLLPQLYEKAVSPEEGNTYGGDELDWIHLNSFDFMGDDLIVSSRELSTIIKISDYRNNPSISYFLADASLYQENDDDAHTLLYAKGTDFISQSGQHTITYLADDALPKGQYYLYMFNNNFTNARTRQDLDWSAFIGAGTYTEGTASYYYQYLVDENSGTYTLVDQVALPYSSIVSSCEWYQDHLISSSGKSNCFNEYDKEGNLIREYHYEAEKYAYRVFKYDFSDFYFQS